jgi:hypothetical protein
MIAFVSGLILSSALAGTAPLICPEGTPGCAAVPNRPLLKGEDRVQRFTKGSFSSSGHGYTLPGNCDAYDQRQVQREVFNQFVNEMQRQIEASGRPVESRQAQLQFTGTDHVASEEPWTNRLGNAQISFTLKNGIVLDVIVFSQRITTGFFTRKAKFYTVRGGFNIGFGTTKNTAYGKDGQVLSDGETCNIFPQARGISILNRETAIPVLGFDAHDVY